MEEQIVILLKLVVNGERMNGLFVDDDRKTDSYLLTVNVWINGQLIENQGKNMAEGRTDI